MLQTGNHSSTPPLSVKAVKGKLRVVNDGGLARVVSREHDGALVVSARACVLVVTELSRFTTQPHSVAVVQGDTARFQCAIHGVPTPLISWTKDAQPLPESDRCASELRPPLYIGMFQPATSGLKRKRRKSIKVEKNLQIYCTEVNHLGTHTHTHPFNGPSFRDYPGEPVPER